MVSRAEPEPGTLWTDPYGAVCVVLHDRTVLVLDLAPGELPEPMTIRRAGLRRQLGVGNRPSCAGASPANGEPPGR